jgi:hypothetical protein
LQGKRNVESEAVSVGDSLSQNEKVAKVNHILCLFTMYSFTTFIKLTIYFCKQKGKRKQSCDGETSVQNKCSVPPQNRGATTTSNMEVRSRPIPPMNVSQLVMHVMPVMPVMQSVGTSSQVQPMHPIYGMPFVQSSNSCFSLLQQVMNNAGHE